MKSIYALQILNTISHNVQLRKKAHKNKQTESLANLSKNKCSEKSHVGFLFCCLCCERTELKCVSTEHPLNISTTWLR